MALSCVYKGVLVGHNDWVTSVATPVKLSNQRDFLVSGSRDKKVMLWRLPGEDQPDNMGFAYRSFIGHSGPIEDITLSVDANYAISASWDKSMRLWDINTGKTVRNFRGHTSDVFSVAFSQDNRQIISGSRDKDIKLWNTLGECKATLEKNPHTDWVSCVRFSPASPEPIIVSCGWDKIVKVWRLHECSCITNLVGHTGALSTVAIAPDGSLCASGGKDETAMLWDVHEGKHLYSLSSGSPIHCLCFSPAHYWLCAATDKSIKIWDLEKKQILQELTPQEEWKTDLPWCISLNWSYDGRYLYAGTSTGDILVYEVKVASYE